MLAVEDEEGLPLLSHFPLEKSALRNLSTKLCPEIGHHGARDTPSAKSTRSRTKDSETHALLENSPYWTIDDTGDRSSQDGTA